MTLFPYTGLVESSGCTVQHTVLVDIPFKVYGEIRNRILVGETQVVRFVDIN